MDCSQLTAASERGLRAWGPESDPAEPSAARELADAPETSERLLSAAEELFGQRSYWDTTVAEICARAGVATGSFYAHFRSKSEIFATVVCRINAELRCALRKAIEQSGGRRELERACFRAFFEVLSQRPRLDRIVRESEFVAPGLFRELHESLARGYARGVRHAQLSGQIDAHYDPEVIAYMYAGIGSFIAMRWAGWTSDGHVPDDVLEDLLAVLARGLPPSAAAPGACPEPGDALSRTC